MRRGKRTALVSTTAAVVVAAAISGAGQSAGANRLDGKLRTNQVQVLATHNSYHIQQDAPIQSLGSWSFIMARPGLSDDAAYRVAKALHQAEAGIAQRLAQGKETTAANTAAAAPRAELIHPGVRRYLGELGLLTR